MGARQSKRSVDISNPPKKGEVEGGEGEGKVERLEEGDVAAVKTTLNGTAPHAEKEVSSPVTEVVEAEAAAATEALPVKDEESKKEETVERKEEEKKEEKKEEKAEAVSSPVTEVKTPEPAPAPAPVTPATPEPVVEVAPTSAPVSVPEPVVVETTPEPAVTKEEETPVEVVPVKTEELPPPLPASPPPTEAPPPTPVAVAPDVTLQTAEADSHECNEVVGGGGESMAEPEDVGPVSDVEDKMEETSAPPPMVNGHHDLYTDELIEKVDVVTESLKTMIVTESVICTQVTETVNAEESEQTASAAE